MVVKKINVTAIAVAAIIVLGILGTVMLIANLTGMSSKTIQTQGSYEITVQPDESAVYVNVQTESESSEQAKAENARITENVREALFNLGLAKSDLETQGFNIYPNYEWEDGKRVDKGFIASNRIKIRTKDFDILGKIIDAAADNGALIENINFELSTDKNNQMKTIALEEASKDARAKAEAITSGLGQKLGKIVSVSTSDYGYSPYPIFAMSGMAEDVAVAKEATVDIEPKNLDIRATVTVVFALK